MHYSPTRDSGNGSCQLNRSHGYCSLSDAHRDGFPGVPLLFESSKLPFLRRHHPVGFLGKIDAGLLPQSKCSGVFGAALNAEFLCESVKEHVTRLVNTFADVYHPMRPVLRNDPAFEITSIKVRATVAGYF